MSSRLFGVGIAGATLLPEERDILERNPPRAVILFRRNVESSDQIRDLTEEIHRFRAMPTCTPEAQMLKEDDEFVPGYLVDREFDELDAVKDRRLGQAASTRFRLRQDQRT